MTGGAARNLRRKDRRLLLGEAALMSLAQAAELLPIDDSEARVILDRCPYVIVHKSRRLIRWGDAIRAIEDDAEQAFRPVAHTRGLRRDD